MKRILNFPINAVRLLRRIVWPPVSAKKLKHTSYLSCPSSLQADGVCNGTQSKKPRVSDPQLFDAQFEELVLELVEKDVTDPALADALNRLREVGWLAISIRCLGLHPREPASPAASPPRCWRTMPREGRGTGACL